MSQASRQRPSVKRAASSKPTRSAKTGQRGKRQTPARVGKAQVLDRVMRDTSAIRQGSLLTLLRKQGYEELPLEDIQDRLSKLRTALAEFIVSRRG